MVALSERPLQLLVVDADRGAAARVREALADPDGSGGEWRILDADSMSMALERMARGSIDVVVLNLDLPDSTLKEVAEEIADIQIYLVRLADKLEIDILAAAEEKLAENDRKYPASRVRGSSKKYSEYSEGGPDR